MRSIETPGPLARAWYRLARGHLQLAGRMLLRCRTCGAEQVPRHGPLLLISNHQSHLDPMLAAVACRRRLRFLARDTLFVGWLGAIIESLGAIPVDREGAALSGIKRTLQALAANEAVLLFPEGRRSDDGSMSALKPGFLSLVRRRRPRVAIMAIDGAYDAWPRHARFPRPRSVVVRFGRVLGASDYVGVGDDALLKLIESELHRCLDDARRMRLDPGLEKPSLHLANPLGGNNLYQL